MYVSGISDPFVLLEDVFIKTLCVLVENVTYHLFSFDNHLYSFSSFLSTFITTIFLCTNNKLIYTIHAGVAN